MKGFTVRLLIFSCAMVLCLSSSAFAANTIKIGIADSYSGPAAIFGLDMRDGFRMGMNEINAKGGVLGKKLEIVTRDEKFQPAVALAMAKELIMKENVDLLMGTISSASALAISELAKKEKVPFLVTYAKSEKITGELGHRYVFSMADNTAMAGRAAGVRHRKKRLYKVLDRRR